MQVSIEQARERADSYYFRLIVNSDLPEEEQTVVEYTYGKDMPLPQIRDEIVALLTNEYGEHADIVLPYEGDVIEL